jgi:2-polyprenyl-3-methyl-5-hydroxy-6-metoxy-1,4-benzoquinol methylase
MISPGLNNLQYQLHGIQMALRVLRETGATLTEARRLDVLDYGCGSGKVSRPLALMFRRVVGYDPSEACIDTARTECPPWPQCSLSNLCYISALNTAEGFDVVCAVNVLEHMTEIGSLTALDQIKTQLKPCGMAILWIDPVRNKGLAREFQVKTSAQQVVVWRKP